jgi:hypothetical protein
MSYRELIASMKKSSRNEAQEVSLEVFNQDKKIIGRLVPVGQWILDDHEKIELIRSWRQRAMRMFLTQFESTVEKTRSYLENLSVFQEGRILFLLFDAEDRFVGHLGVANIDGKTGELDNLMRGLEGGDPRLIYFSELALLDWYFKNLDVAESYVRVLSYNWLVISLHEEVGYVLYQSLPLRRHVKDGVTFHDVSTELESNVKYSCLNMRLERDSFYQVNSWLR